MGDYGKKLVDKAMAGKAGHRIAVIGQEIFKDIDSTEFTNETYSVSLHHQSQFDNNERLVNYTLCIVAYDAFQSDGLQNNFIKQMLEALDNGVNICFVYYTDHPTKNKHTGHDSAGATVSKKINVTPGFLDKLAHEASIKKQEFQPFLKKWGVTNLKFESSDKNVKPLYVTDESEILGFSADFKNAEIFFLPFINTSSRNDRKNGLETLIDNLLTYLAKSRVDLPVWAKENPFFSDEGNLLDEKEKLQKSLQEVESNLQKFDEAKSLLFHSEHHLEITLPIFLKTHLGLKIEQNETYKEDFWIVDEKREKLAIAEIKSKTKGFTKGLVGYLLAHRDHYELGDDFPALLFVNCNLQVGSWKDKDKPLNEQEYKSVANQNILVIRVEDIVRLWEMKRLEKITSEEILKLLLENRGWLQVTSKLEIKIHPKKK